MRVLVSGCSGVVGKYLVKELLKDPNIERIVGITRKARYFYEDHPDRESGQIECYADLRLDCVRLITQLRPDIIYHCAGQAQVNSDPKGLWEANVNTTFNLLQACTKLDKIVRFVYPSTIMVNHNPFTLYAASKLSGENLIKSYRSCYNNITGYIIRFCAVAGAGNKHGVVKAVVDQVVDKNKKELNLLTNSNKPIIYAKQLIEEMIKHTKFDHPYSPDMIFCPKDTIRVNEIADIAMDITKYKKNIIWSGKSWPGDKKYVQPPGSSVNMFSSELAVKLAIQDILKEDYNYAG